MKQLSIVGLLTQSLVQVQALAQGALQPRPASLLLVASADILPTSTLPVTSVYDGSIPPIQSTTTTALPGTIGSVHISLESSGRASAAPFDISKIITAPSSVKLSLSESLATPSGIAEPLASKNIFQPISVNAPPDQILFRSDHLAKAPGLVPQSSPLQTNKFYANLFLGDQAQPVWTHPYIIIWDQGRGEFISWGLSVSHVERSLLTYGPLYPPSGAPQYFVSPTGIQHIVLSAAELGPAAVLTTDSHQAFSVNANLSPLQGTAPIISFPLVQGMGFVTALYNKGTVILQSGVFFSSLSFVGAVNKDTTFKYRITLKDGSNWLLYVTPNGAAGAPPFILVDSTTIRGPNSFQGTVQIAKNPAGAKGERDYDKAAGAYPISASISATVDDNVSSYKLSWKKAGSTSKSLLMFALPHHVESMSLAMKSRMTSIQLYTITKGLATAFLGDSFKLIEPDLPVDIGFDPWSPTRRSAGFVPAVAVQAINDAASIELAQDLDKQSNLNSMYYSGKALSKFALIVYASYRFGSNSTLALAGLRKLQAAFSTFAENRQYFPVVYDTFWRGVVSSATYTTLDANQDFGNSFYNDHHFHYGYFVHAAAIIGYLDRAWLKQGSNKEWVNMLVRDYANGIETDPYFPFSRNFDWYHGHSWAKGLFDSADGKDEESTSEDTFAYYAMKMWGQVIGDANMKARGNLQLAILTRSLRNYFLYTVDNTVQPPDFIPNKASGILFENKIDHTTYFGSRTEEIQGIHMIPINPVSAYTRSSRYVAEEWQTYFAYRDITDLAPGWRGIVAANYAIVDPVASWRFFSDPSFNFTSLDDGASLTWYLAWAAGLGGV